MHDLQRIDEDGLHLVSRGLVGIGEFGQVIGEPARCIGARALGVAGRLAQAVGGTLECVDIFLIRGRRIDLIGIRVPD